MKKRTPNSLTRVKSRIFCSLVWSVDVDITAISFHVQFFGLEHYILSDEMFWSIFFSRLDQTITNMRKGFLLLLQGQTIEGFIYGRSLNTRQRMCKCQNYYCVWKKSLSFLKTGCRVNYHFSNFSTNLRIWVRHTSTSCVTIDRRMSKCEECW